METVIVAVFGVALSVNCYVMWLMWKELHTHHEESKATDQTIVHIASSVNLIREVLTEASRIKAARPEPQPASDKIQDDRIPPRKAYVPIARRRAAAEAASQTPATHDARVRENNVRAMETAG